MTDLLRTSRDGDQFHYHWAARQSLKLLRFASGLKAIVVEGTAPGESLDDDGDEVIDVAEYYGGKRLEGADKVLYRQLKHSTVMAEEEWTVSGLKKTLSKFAKKYVAIRDNHPGLERKIYFSFVSNRPVRSSVLQALEHIATSGAAPIGHDVKYILEYLDLPLEEASEFCSRFTVEEQAPGLLSLENIFRQDVSAFLAGAPVDAPLLLKEMVTRRATSLEEERSPIDATTVLTALKTTSDQLLPAPNLISAPDYVIPTGQVSDIVGILSEARGPVILHAPGGLGKSVMATQIGAELPPGSVSLVYDCFGLGDYRRSSTPRHGHRQGIIQIANELAAFALCDPLIPSPTARNADYSKVFLARVTAAAESLEAQTPGALLVIVIDAADNAVLAAQEDGSQTSFVVDLLGEQWPGNVRLLATARTERIGLLRPPPSTTRVELQGFTQTESMAHLASRFSPVSIRDGAEFHRRTGGNPRVQALVMSAAASVNDCLRALGEASQVDGSVLDGLLQNLVDHFKYDYPGWVQEIDLLCQALAGLRPRIPVDVLSRFCNVPPALVRSFAGEMGRALLIDNDYLQFRDEPTETWFRTRYWPSGPELATFVERLRPLADEDPYIAAALPQLLWQANRVDELVELAISDAGLPADNELERQEIAQHRAQFALKGTLRVGRLFDATRLALKAGALSAGQSRRLRLLRNNTDLAGKFLDPEIQDNLVAARSLTGDWPGSNLPYEACLLSASLGQADFARNRIRSAAEWMHAWVRQPQSRRDKKVGSQDIAELALGLLNTDGVEHCVGYLGSWRPSNVAFDCGLIVARRLADVGRTEELEALAYSAAKVKHLQLAVAAAASAANIPLEAKTTRRLVAMLRRHKRPIPVGAGYPRGHDSTLRDAINWIVAMGIRHGLLPLNEAERILGLYLPTKLPSHSASHFGDGAESLMQGFALLAKTRSERFTADSIADQEVRSAMEKPYSRTRALVDFETNIVPLLPWAELWVAIATDVSTEVEAAFLRVSKDGLNVPSDYETPYVLINAVARQGARSLATESSTVSREQFMRWLRQTQRHLKWGTLIDVARIAASAEGMHESVLDVSEMVRTAVDEAREDADMKAESIVKLARAVYRFDASEAKEHFAHAVELTNRVGDEVHVRLESLLKTAAATSSDANNEKRGYRLSQVVECLEPYLGDYTDFEAGLSAISHLSPTMALAVASRWRDRRVSYARPLLAALVANPSSPFAARPLAALAMLPFEDNLPALQLLKCALLHPGADAQAIVEATAEFERPKRYPPAVYAELERVAGEVGVDLTGTAFDPATYEAEPLGAPYSLGLDPQPSGASDVQRERNASIEAALKSHDLRTAAGWDARYELVRSTDPAVAPRDLVSGVPDVPVAGLADMLDSFQANANFSVYDYALMVDELAAVPRMPRAAVTQVRCLAQTIATRFCRQITLLRYDPVNLKILGDLAGQGSVPVLESAFRELGTQGEPFNAEECFVLAGKLVACLEPEQAASVFDEAERQFVEVAPLESCDGLFEDLPPLPSSLVECIAGYVWASLGDAKAASRWRAAHAIHLMISLKCNDELRALMKYAANEADVQPFTDKRLPFYTLHALQWLLWGLRRAANAPGNAESLGIFEPLLKRTAFDGDPHVIMRDSAMSILNRLNDTGHAQLTASELSRCQKGNTPLTVRGMKRHGKLSGPSKRAQETASNASHKAASEFTFFLDFLDHWCAPLAAAFALPPVTIQSLVNQVIVNLWNSPHRGSFNEDPRHTLKLFQDSDAHVYKSSWPQEDDLDFYLCTHALLTVAGQLLEELPVHKEPDMDEDAFTHWLHDFTLTRDDGRWLADRRDPRPIGSSEPGTYETQTAEWMWQLGAADFAEHLIDPQGFVTVWESSTDTLYNAEQQVGIQSALATAETARSLVLALQTAPSYMGFRIPDTTDSTFQYSKPLFELTGWIQPRGDRHGRDKNDPFAGSVHFPPTRPADWVAEMLTLSADADMRAWRCGNTVVMDSIVWSDSQELGSRRSTGTAGHRLKISQEKLKELLTTTRKSLVITVMVHRTHDEHSRSHYDDEFTYPERSFKVYLFDEHGGCRDL